MSSVTYSVAGQTIELEIIYTNSVNEEPIFDDRGNYIFTKVTLDVSCVYNPAATSYRRNGLVTISQKGQMAPTTEEAIRHYLMLPQGQLTYQVGSVVQLQSPRNGAVTDANNGPQPRRCVVSRLNGERTFTVDWRIDTFIHEAHKYVADPNIPVLISHNWSQSETLDDLYYPIRITNGRCVFDMSRVPAGAVLDDYRGRIVPPTPGGFKRVSVDVTVEGSGNTLSYRILDRRYRLNYKKHGVAKCEVLQYGETVAPDVTSSVNNTVNSLAHAGMSGYSTGLTAARLATAAGLSNTIVEGSGWAGAAIGFGLSFSSNISLGRSNYGITVRVYGTENAPIAFLQNEALKIVAWKFTDLNNEGRPGRPNSTFYSAALIENTWNTSFRITQDCVLGMVEITKSHTRTLSGNWVSTVADYMKNNGDDAEPTIAAWEDIAPNAQARAGAATPHNDNGSRGWWIGRLIGQQLSTGVNRKPNRHPQPSNRVQQADPHA